MAKISKAKQIELKNAEHAFEVFEKMFKDLPDPRRAQGKRYSLRVVIVSALMSMIAGADDAESMAKWARINESWLATFLDMPYGAPTQDVILAVFAALKPEAFAKVFRSWVDLISLRMRLKNVKPQIAIDGKAVRRSKDVPKNQPAAHIVSAWSKDFGLVIGQIKCEEKSNEITAIPDLLAVLDIKSTVITLDAMGCQKKIVKTIIDAGGDYIIGLKKNQLSLYNEVENHFSKSEIPSTHIFEKHECSHGRKESRKLCFSNHISSLSSTQDWNSLSCVIEIQRRREELSSGKISVETSYYICSLKNATAESLFEYIKGHWSIENSLHWVLDIAFREDESRHRSGNCAQNMSLLRHFSLNIIKKDKKRKLGVANTRKQAGWDREYLLELILNSSD